MPILIVLIGPVGCGKSTLAKTLTQKTKEPGAKEAFHRVNQDEQGRHGHFTAFIDLILKGKDVVVDRMNFNREQRMRYVEPARRQRYKIHYILFCTHRDTCLERVRIRKNHPTIGPDSDHEKIVDFFYKNFEFPWQNEYDSLEREYD